MELITPTIRPTKKQQEAWDLLDFNNTDAQNIGFGGGAGGGKTWLACEWLITNCYRFPFSRWFIGREELTRLKKSTFQTFKKVCRYHSIPDTDWRLDSQNSTIIFNNGSTIDLIDVAFKPSDADYERFGSLEYTGGFGEEVGEWHFDAFDILKSRIGRHNHFDINKNEMCEKPIDFKERPQKYGHILELPPKFLLTFNPSRGWLYRTFYEPWKKGTLEKGYAFVQTLYMDNPYVADLYGRQLEGIKNKVNKARLKDGDWEYTDDMWAMTTLEYLQDLFSNTVVLDGQKYMTVDVAGEGKDYSVLTVWEGLRVKSVTKINGQDTADTTQDIKDLASAEQIPWSHIAIDAIGIGEGVASGLKGCVAFKSTRSAFLTKTAIRDKKNRISNPLIPTPTTDYANLKTQCAFKLAELINEHKISAINIGEYRDELIADLTATLQERDGEKEGKKKMATKQEIKDELGRSPDIGDTFLMRMYWILKADASDVDPLQEKRVLEVQQSQLRKNIKNISSSSTR